MPPSESTIRASVGVISGRSVTSCGGSSLSLKQYIWSVISSPPLRLNSAVFSRTGASYLRGGGGGGRWVSARPTSGRRVRPRAGGAAAAYSWKANERATERNCAKSQLRTRISSGKKSRVPDGGSNEIGIRSCLTSGMPALFFVSPDFVTPAALCSAFFAAFSAFFASFASAFFDLPSPSPPSPPPAAAAAAGAPLPAGAAGFAAAAGVGAAISSTPHTAISRFASAAVAEHSSRLRARSTARSPRIEPSAAFAGSASPASACTAAGSASHTSTTAGPETRKSTSAAKSEVFSKGL